MSQQSIKFDDAAKDALRRLQADLDQTRREIVIHTQFRRNTAVSPLDPAWGQPNPIDITGLVELAFTAGIRHANEVIAQQAMPGGAS